MHNHLELHNIVHTTGLLEIRKLTKHGFQVEEEVEEDAEGEAVEDVCGKDF